MFTLHDALLLMLLPFVIGAAAVALAWRPRRFRGGGSAGGGAMMLGIAGGVLAAGVAAFPPKGMPREAMDVLVFLPAVALGVGLVGGVLPWWVGIVLVLIAGGVDGWLIATHLAVGSVSWGTLGLLAVGPVIVYGALVPVVAKRSGVGMVLMMLMIAGATVIVESAGTFIQFGQYSVALAAAMAGVLLARLVLRGPAVSRGSWAGFVLIWMAIIAFGYLWADVTAMRTGLLAIAPLLAWMAEIPRGLRPVGRGILRLGVVAVPLAVATVPAGIELAKLLRSQTEVGGY